MRATIVFNDSKQEFVDKGLTALLLQKTRGALGRSGGFGGSDLGIWLYDGTISETQELQNERKKE